MARILVRCHMPSLSSWLERYDIVNILALHIGYLDVVHLSLEMFS